MQGIVMTSDAEFLETAMEEVHQLFPEHKQTFLAPGLSWLDAGAELETMQARLLATPPIFVRHQHAAVVWTVTSEQELRTSVTQCLLADLDRAPAGVQIAVQARAIDSDFTWQPRDLKAACDEVLIQQGYQPAIKDPEWVISVTQIKNKVYYGLAPASDNFSDWMGGMLHFRKTKADVSRAKFKLLEAIVRFGLEFPASGLALDLGAAPGGWTQELLERGLKVIAVDTGELDERLLALPGIRFLQQNVKDLSFLPTQQFDVITCDMSWDPFFSVKLLNGLIPNLRANGQVIMTVKLMGKRPLPTIRRVLDSMHKKLVVRHAKHLWHNRQEITVHLVKVK